MKEEGKREWYRPFERSIFSEHEDEERERGVKNEEKENELEIFT